MKYKIYKSINVGQWTSEMAQTESLNKNRHKFSALFLSDVSDVDG